MSVLKLIKKTGGHFLALAFIVSACSLTPESSIPGEKPNPVTLKPFAVTTVLSALKCQIDRGFVEIEKKQALRAKGDPRARSFNLLKGSATFSGKTTTVGTDDGNISIIIPTGISEITPNIGGKFVSTSTQFVTRNFSVAGNAYADSGTTDKLTEKNKDKK